MDQDEYQSLSKGVFVIPFQLVDENQAGPSKPKARPLQELYDTTFEHYERAYIEYSADQTAEQLDDISDWIDRCSAPPLLKMKNPIYRLEVGLLQNASSTLPPLLHTTGSKACNIHGRDINDVNAAMKAIATGFMGESSSSGKKTGRSGIEEVEIWYKAQKNKASLLLHIQEAQIIPASVLGELMYIFSLHPSLPVRLLLSVPSITHFLSSWTPIELSSIALSLLSSGNRKRNNGVEAILRASESAPLKISDELADEIRSEESKSGGGPMLALKAIKWLLLHHSMNSPLSQLASSSDSTQLKKIQALLNASMERPDDPTLPGRGLFQIDMNKDLSSVLNPAPRTSILHALSNHADYIPPVSTDQAKGAEKGRDTLPEPTKLASNKRKSMNLPQKDKDGAGTSKRIRTEDDKDGKDEETGKGEELKELQMLLELWKSAGKSVNLWDWLEGFSDLMSTNDQHQAQTDEDDSQSQQRVMDGNSKVHDGQGVDGDKETEDSELDMGKEKENGNGGEADNEENQARLHAIFIRFVEEARMIGLIRARGKGRKADEVVKGVGLV